MGAFAARPTLPRPDRAWAANLLRALALAAGLGFIGYGLRADPLRALGLRVAMGITYFLLGRSNRAGQKGIPLPKYRPVACPAAKAGGTSRPEQVSGPISAA